jgi:hypothetical protein
VNQILGQLDSTLIGTCSILSIRFFTIQPSILGALLSWREIYESSSTSGGAFYPTTKILTKNDTLVFKQSLNHTQAAKNDE